MIKLASRKPLFISFAFALLLSRKRLTIANYDSISLRKNSPQQRGFWNL